MRSKSNYYLDHRRRLFTAALAVINRDELYTLPKIIKQFEIYQKTIQNGNILKNFNKDSRNRFEKCGKHKDDGIDSRPLPLITFCSMQLKILFE